MTNKLNLKITASAAAVFVLSMTGTVQGATKEVSGGASEKLSHSYTEQSTVWKTNRVVISEYDQIIRRVADDKGYDWRFISAMAFAESRFNPKAVSYAGALGLMQVMPSTARGFKVDPKSMRDPETNVTVAVRLLEQIGKTLRFPRSISERDRLSIILAAYNCGIGHVLDARRLAVKYGENHNSWSVVAKYLQLKSEPEYYEDPVVRCGDFNGSDQTLGYVKKVMRYYNSYCEIAML